MSLSYKFYGTVDDWWVIYYFNDFKDTTFALENARLLDSLITKHIKALQYYIFSNTDDKNLAGQGVDAFQYTIALILGANAGSAPTIPIDPDLGGVENPSEYYLEKGRLYLLELLRKYYQKWLGESFENAITSANNIIKLVELPAEFEYDFREFLFTEISEEFNLYTDVKIPIEEIKDDIKDLMFEKKIIWHEENLNIQKVGQ
jgi:hypothetical protein